MPAYVLVKVNAPDPEKLKPYQEAAPIAVKKYNGKILVRGGEVASLEGQEETRRVVMLEFETMKDAKAFYHSEEYQKAVQLREGVADFEIIAIDGV